MKHILYSIALGLLVFIVSFQLLDEPAKEARVLSSFEAEQKQSEEPPPLKRDTIENEPIKKNYEPATVVQQDDQTGIVPTRLEIPSIGVDAPIGPEGYTDNGGMAVPDSVTRVGWFEPGTKPGRIGNAVIAGHVDGQSGPAVFYDLKELKAGDEIFVYGEDGSKMTFTVEKVAAYPVEESPIRDLFGPTNERALNLITCTGPYDQEASGYTERLAVYTTLTASDYKQ
ncbi:class F sortase [Halobacillus litoralis]|uniref:class F sortase n=1 Tax=Halobacillus litoralis TaxID=45668 RepID=UPI001CD48E24|nr:class F sortase [Halobacillus litoralis]MCA0971826.1 class F sortase [Halobacillus litoralis]